MSTVCPHCGAYSRRVCELESFSEDENGDYTLCMREEEEDHLDFRRDSRRDDRDVHGLKAGDDE